MAVRQQHMHDIVERRLRPIYDWLDNGNNKKALQEAEKVLKKSPTLQAARALKALALLRLGKGSEAHAVLDALASEQPSDDTTLQAMTISYRESQQLPKVCKLYEAAVKKEPTNEELYSHLFMSYVRVGDYHSQQRAAMALYKFAPKNPYYFWAVMSIVLQAQSSQDETKKGILLALARRMIDNFINENKMEAEQEARLYIMILKLQDKWEDILKFVESPLYSKLMPESTAQASIPYLKKLGQWRRLNLITKELLWEEQDRWDYYIPYFDSVFQLMKENNCESNCENSIDDTAEKCHEFICQLIESMSPGKPLRGPYLARLELWRRLAEDGDPTALLGSGVALCVEYLRVFANKPCAVPDLRQYVAMLPQKEREDHSRDFLTCLDFDENSQPDKLEDVQRHISCLAAWRLAAAPLPAGDSLALAGSLRAHYLRCLARGLGAAAPYEFGPVDSYAVLAAHQYFNAALEEESSAPIYEALCLLELVLHHSPSNFHVKLLLVQLYHLIGNALAADSVYQRLDVKHIQLLSLGWLHAARLAPACAFTRALQLLADVRTFHTHHAKDSVEHLTYAYKYGTFETLAELYAWGARVDACAGAALAGRERPLLALLAGPPAPLHAPSALPNMPTDNRDLNAIVSWQPPHLADGELAARTHAHESAYLRLKDALVSAIALCIELVDARQGRRACGDKHRQRADLAACVAAFGGAMLHCRDLTAHPHRHRETITISAPFPSRIIGLVNSPVPYRELYASTLKLVGELSAGHGPAVRGACSRATQLVRAARGMLARELESAGGGGDRFWRMRGWLETVSNYMEFTGIITFLLGVCNELVAPASTRKTKKKAHQSPEEVETIKLLTELNEAVQESVAYLEELFDNMPRYQFESTLDVALGNLTLTDNYKCPVQEKLINGQEEMLNDVKNILKRKSKYLKSLLQ